MKFEKILLVDDEIDILFLFSELFASHGFSVETAENGIVAIEKVIEGRPDIILSDIRMPICNGLEMFKKISFNLNIKVPILFMSGYAGVDELSTIVHHQNFRGFIAKPIEMEVVLNKIREIES